MGTRTVRRRTVRELSCRRTVLSANCLVGALSCQRTVLSANCSVGQLSYRRRVLSANCPCTGRSLLTWKLPHKSDDCRFESLAISRGGALKLNSPLELITNSKVYCWVSRGTDHKGCIFTWRYSWLEYVDKFWEFFIFLKSWIWFFRKMVKNSKLEKNNVIFNSCSEKCKVSWANFKLSQYSRS